MDSRQLSDWLSYFELEGRRQREAEAEPEETPVYHPDPLVQSRLIMERLGKKPK